MSYQAIYKAIKAKDFKPVYLLHGEESYFIDELTQLLIDTTLQPHERDFNLSVLYGKEVSVNDVIGSARQFPMMAQNRVVVLKEGQQMRNFKDLELYFNQVVPSTILVLNYKGKKADGRAKLTQLVKKNGVLFHAEKLKEWNTPAWIKSYLTGKGYTVIENVETLIADYLGNSLSTIVNELEKLIINIEKKATINKALVEKYIGIHRDYNMFALQNALAEKNSLKAFRVAYYFAENSKNNPMVVVLSNLFSFFNKLYIYHSCKHLSPREQMQAIKVHNNFIFQQTEKAARFYSVQKLKHIFKLIQTADLKSKGVGATERNEAGIYKELIYKILN